jgi:hypothetical protein
MTDGQDSWPRRRTPQLSAADRRPSRSPSALCHRSPIPRSAVAQEPRCGGRCQHAMRRSPAATIMTRVHRRARRGSRRPEPGRRGRGGPGRPTGHCARFLSHRRRRPRRRMLAPAPRRHDDALATPDEARRHAARRGLFDARGDWRSSAAAARAAEAAAPAGRRRVERLKAERLRLEVEEYGRRPPPSLRRGARRLSGRTSRRARSTRRSAHFQAAPTCQFDSQSRLLSARASTRSRPGSSRRRWRRRAGWLARRARRSATISRSFPSA